MLFTYLGAAVCYFFGVMACHGLLFNKEQQRKQGIVLSCIAFGGAFLSGICLDKIMGIITSQP